MSCEFKNNKNAKETTKRMSCVYSLGVITDCQVWIWLSKFNSGDMSLSDDPRPRHWSDLDKDTFKRIGGMQSIQNYLKPQ